MNRGTSVHEGASSSSYHQTFKLCSTFRVPPGMRAADEYNYIPKLVSIGPLHRKNPCLQAMEAHKFRFLHRLLGRFEHQPGTMSLDSLKRDMQEFEKPTRDSYFEDFDYMTSDEFVEMMVIDGCFVVELLRLFDFNFYEDIADRIFSTRFMLLDLSVDLLLIENQLPLFVLQKLYELTANQHEIGQFNVLVSRFFWYVEPTDSAPDIGGKQHEHLLALFQSIFIKKENYSSNEQETDKKKSKKENYHLECPTAKWFGSAMELMCAGITFEKGRGSYLQVEFDPARKKLKIPTLFLDNVTPQILRNAVAYEQCNRNVEPYFTSLVVFFDMLVDSPQEVKYLRRNGIIDHILGSDEEATEVINKLSKGVFISQDECYICEEVDKINKFTKSRWAVWRAALYMYYFINQEPLNLLLFYLAIIQTFSSLYQIIFDSIKSKDS